MARHRIKLPKQLPGDFIELVRLFAPVEIVDDAGYENMRDLIDALDSLPRPTRGQAQYLNTLTILFEAYEQKRFCKDFEGVSPTDVLRMLMEENGLKQSDLGRIIGDATVASRVLSGKRGLSIEHIRRLSDHFNVSADAFIAT